MAFILTFAVGLAVVRGSGAEAPRIVADGASLTLEARHSTTPSPLNHPTELDC